MITYKNDHTKFRLSQAEVTEAACKLVIFCRMNSDSRQSKKLKKQLLKLEDALASGKFKK